MIPAGSAVTLRRVPMTAVRLSSNNQAEVLDDYFGNFHSTLLAGDDLPPVLLLWDQDSGLYRLGDGRKRFAAHILAGRPEILAVVVEAETCTAGVAGPDGSRSAASPGSPPASAG